MGDHRDLRMVGEERVVVAAPTTTLYELVSDVTRMGQWSPELRSAEWIEGEPGAVGSRFSGRNEADGATWITSCTVTEAKPGHSFCFVVGTPERGSTRWMFLLRPLGPSQTEVTERFEWEWVPQQTGFRAEVGAVPFDEAVVMVRDRGGTLREGMRRTLDRLRATAEAEAASDPPTSR